MKRLLLPLMTGLLMATELLADDGVLVLPAPSFDGCHTQIAYPSLNGEWATGGVYDGTVYQAFRWNTRNNEFEFLNTYGPFSFGYAVSNDGMVAGEFGSTELLNNGAEIESPCVWYDGRWHNLDIGTQGKLDPELPSIGAARYITSDGRHVVGALNTSKGWTACIWDLDTHHTSHVTMLPMEEAGVAEHMSDDGSIIGGFDEARGIRIPAYWTRSGSSIQEVIPDGRKHMGQWTTTCGISPDGRYVATWNKLFDLKENTCVQFDSEVSVDAVMAAGVTSHGTIYGSAQKLTASGATKFAAYYRDGDWHNLQQYLISKGAKFPKGCTLEDLRYVSDDEQTYFVNASLGTGLVCGMMIRLGQNITSRPPVALKAKQMTGLTAIRLTWAEPLTNAAAVTGYTLYRDGKQIYTGTATSYTDRSGETGKTYTYTVRAQYAEGISSSDSDPATVTLELMSMAAPSNLTARQSGLCKVRLAWDAAGTSLPALKYYEDGRNVTGFGGGAWDMETAVRFRNADLQLYRNMEISEVSFWPMTAQTSWTLNFYYASQLNGEPFYSEKLDPATLQYNTRNTIRLAQPIQVPATEDVVVSVAVDVAKTSYNVLGLILNDNDPGYNDLIRQPGQPFVSLYEDAKANGMDYPYCWAISLGMAPIGGETVALHHYQIYQDGQAVAQAPAQSHKYTIPSVEDGEHLYAVTAVYADATESARTEAAVSVEYNYDYYNVSDLSVTTDQDMRATVTWKAPTDDEETYVDYCTETCDHGMRTSATEGYSFQAASVYPHSMLEQYLEDYQISGVRFYPLGNAEFSLYINGGNDNLWSRELERGVDYTLGAWNTLWLDKPIPLDGKYNEYHLIIDCYDGDADVDILGMDNMPANIQYSDLYSMDDGASWSSYYTESGARGNWLMGLVITSREQSPLPVQSYIVYWDGKDYNGPIAANGNLSATHQFAQPTLETLPFDGHWLLDKHRVSVAAVYGDTKDDIWNCTPYYFNYMFAPTTGIATTPATAPTAARGQVYDLTGRRVTTPQRGVYIMNGKKILTR